MINKYFIFYNKILIIISFCLFLLCFISSLFLFWHIPPIYTITDNNTKNIENEKEIFQKLNCGSIDPPKSTKYIKEFVIPSYCNIPIAITFDQIDKKIWFISTKEGYLTNFDPITKKFQFYKIPTWSTRNSEIGNSWSWDLKLDPSGKNIWFTDEKQNSVWKFSKDKKEFTRIIIPSKSRYYETSYPISIVFGNNNDLYVIGIRTLSLWHIDLNNPINKTNYKITEFPIPLNKTFNGIDEYEIGLGSMAIDTKKENIWITALVFNKKGVLINYNIQDKKFKVYDLPKTVTSPVGIAVDHNDDIWVTDHGTSSFYKINPKKIFNKINETNLEHFVTSPISTRIFGEDFDKYSQNFSNNIGNTLPYWIKVSNDNTIWFNEHIANRIAEFIPKNNKLIEYWIPSQNIYYSICNPTSNLSCGYSNVLQFSIEENETNKNNETPSKVWFTEQSENKLGFINLVKPLPIDLSLNTSSIDISSQEKENIKEIKMNILQNKLFERNNSMENSIVLKPIISGSFSPNGEIKEMHAIFKPGLIRFNFDEKANQSNSNNTSLNIKLTNLDKIMPGNYNIMLGVESQDFSVVKKITLKISK